MSERRAGRMGIVVKLLPVSLLLLAIPWLAGRYFERFAEFVLAGQKTSLPLAAQAVAGAMLGPFRPSRMEACPAAMFAMPIGTVKGESLRQASLTGPAEGPAPSGGTPRSVLAQTQLVRSPP